MVSNLAVNTGNTVDVRRILDERVFDVMEECGYLEKTSYGNYKLVIMGLACATALVRPSYSQHNTHMYPEVVIFALRLLLVFDKAPEYIIYNKLCCCGHVFSVNCSHIGLSIEQAAQFNPWSFPENRWLLGGCCVLYASLSILLQIYVYFVDKDFILFCHTKTDVAVQKNVATGVGVRADLKKF